MARPGFVDQQELLRWANTLGSRSDFPRLIRRLILETGRGVVQLGFPAGEGTGVGSWDGTVRATEATAYIPAGLSLWELSVEKSVGRKADDDYDKRTTTPDASLTGDCTYVAASLRRWSKRSDWARDRSKEGRWRRVRAYGVDDVETWLEDAPVTHAWISEELGLGPHGLRAAESWWEAWSSATTPPISTGVVLAGRADAEQQLRQRLTNDPHLITVKAGSLQEVLAFVAAVAIRAADEGDAQLLARTAFIDEIVAWRGLLNRRHPLVLVPLKDVAAEASFASSHHVIVPVVGGARADIELSPIDPAGAAGALRSSGLEERRADSAGRLARRSLVALRRHLAHKPELDRPSWAAPPVGRTERGIMLANSWNDSTEGDQKVLAGLTATDYEALREELASFAAEEDPLVAVVDRTWALVSPYDAWLQLRGSLREDDLKRLERAVREVLLEVDPALELSESDRWRASIEGKVRAYSPQIRSGLAAALALLGVHGEEIDVGGGSTGANWAGYLVRGLLAEANEDASCGLWISLSDLLPLLAEAAPDTFLAAVRAGLQGDEPLLAGLFTDRQDTGIMGPGPAHTGLLWALEGVAWSPDHFGQAIDLLARLSEIDPGGRWANRPFNSLKEIYCPWRPENAVNDQRRLAAIDGLRTRHADVAWQLMLALLPDLHGVHSPTHEPQFREWKPPRVGVSRVEYLAFIRELTERLIEDVADLPERWQGLIEESTTLPEEDRVSVRTAFAGRVKNQALHQEGRRALWSAIRALIAKHREFADVGWALPEDELEELERIEQSIAPTEPSLRLGWLFAEHMPDLGAEQQRKGTYQAYTEALQERRRGAIDDIERAEGLDGVRRLAEESPVPWFVGAALTDAREDQYEDELLPLLEETERSAEALARGYFTRRFHQAGWRWLEEKLGQDPPLSAMKRARLLLIAGDVPKAWEVADAQGKEVAEAYWRSFSPTGLGHDFPHVAEVARRLFAVGRSAAGLDMLGLYMRDAAVDPNELAQLAADGLEALLSEEASDPEVGTLAQYDFETMFSHLEAHQEAVGWERVARLEWGYLAALGYDANVPTLNRLLSSDPEFFVQVLTAIYHPKSGRDESAAPSPDEQRVASNAYRLLSSWKTVPGVDDKWQLDAETLRTWVVKARQLLEEADRKDVGDAHIGHVLAHSPPDAGGGGLRTEVRDLIEELQSDPLDEGVETELYNQRGITSRGLEEGGGQERALAAKYREEADRVADQWPRSASILRELAKTYEHDARRNDAEAEQRRRGLD